MQNKGFSLVGLVLVAFGTSAFTRQASPVVNNSQDWVTFGIVLVIILVIAILLIVQGRLSPSAAASYHLDHAEHDSHNLIQVENEQEPVETEEIVAQSSEELLASPIPENEPPVAALDDLTRIEGIGPKISLLLNQVGIFTFDQLANSDVDTLKAALMNAGPQFGFADPTTWPEQAGLLEAGEVDKFDELVKKLHHGRKV